MLRPSCPGDLPLCMFLMTVATSRAENLTVASPDSAAPASTPPDPLGKGDSTLKCLLNLFAMAIESCTPSILTGSPPGFGFNLFNQQLTDIMKENQKLKKINAKLIAICKKRGKDQTEARENADFNVQG
ncbi:unnamed protein product [Plutella xylostella]|uniref:(diamondback moth) hypothetical protein n=1 Tax=Plutella xylostella TaxID=51655 RepID=A0A8S4D549_PLUXY|nr:unnamed protein product [Plutella xylostella]